MKPTQNVFGRALSVVVLAAAMLAPVGLSTASAQDHHPIRTEIIRTVSHAPAPIARPVIRAIRRHEAERRIQAMRHERAQAMHRVMRRLPVVIRSRH